MNFTPFSRLAAICGLLVIAPLAFAQQSAKMPAEITKVDFKEVPVGTKYPLVQVAVTVRALENMKILKDPAAVVPNKGWVDKIKVTVTVAFETTSGTAKKGQGGAFAFYRSAATILTMEKNDTGVVYFYIPGEIKKRENLKTTPFAYLAELEVDGTAVPPSKNATSSNLRNEAEVAGFKSEAMSGAIDTVGIMRPQFQVQSQKLEGFHNLTPTLLREDATNL